MVSRVTDDYVSMVLAGCRAVCEPAFWAGFDRTSVAGFYDYFRQLTEYEPRRAARYGLPHYSWLCINPKESENMQLGEQVLGIIPEFLPKPNVLGIGEIGLNKNTRNELTIFEKHVDLAARHDVLMLVHTPHLEDKLKGTLLIIEALQKDSRISPDRVIIDHAEEHTIRPILDAGFWAGITLYPETKATSARAIDMVESFGPDRIWLNSACDWGQSDPLAVVKAGMEMSRRGHDDAAIDRVLFENPRRFLSQSPKFCLSSA